VSDEARELDILKRELQVAIEIELATIPPYLTALFSLPDGSNRESQVIVRNVVMEEMLHMTLAANVLNAIGGTPRVGRHHHVPGYPTNLPWHSKGFAVGLAPFSKSQVQTFCRIETPEEDHPLRGQQDLLDAERAEKHGPVAVEGPPPEPRNYTSIGEFYAALIGRLHWLVAEMGPAAIFTGPRERQVDAEEYYGGSGHIVAVHDLASAVRALKEIVHQGEGTYTSVWEGSREKAIPKQPAHFYLFDEIVQGRYYKTGDKPHHPKGEPLHVAWNTVYRSSPNPKAQRYQRAYPEIAEKLRAFDEVYLELLDEIGRAFNGEPGRLRTAVKQMYELRYSAVELMRIPDPMHPGHSVGPSFGSLPPKPAVSHDFWLVH
jgi:hypothetical protein